MGKSKRRKINNITPSQAWALKKEQDKKESLSFKDEYMVNEDSEEEKDEPREKKNKESGCFSNILLIIGLISLKFILGITFSGSEAFDDSYEQLWEKPTETELTANLTSEAQRIADYVIDHLVQDSLSKHVTINREILPLLQNQTARINKQCQWLGEDAILVNYRQEIQFDKPDLLWFTYQNLSHCDSLQIEIGITLDYTPEVVYFRVLPTQKTDIVHDMLMDKATATPPPPAVDEHSILASLDEKLGLHKSKIRPQIIGSILFFERLDGIYGYSLKTDTYLWYYTVRLIRLEKCTITVQKDLIILADGNIMVCLDPTRGKEVCQVASGLLPVSSANYVVLSYNKPYPKVKVLHNGSGVEVGVMSLPGKIANLAVSNTQLIWLGWDEVKGNLSTSLLLKGFDISTGNELWTSSYEKESYRDSTKLVIDNECIAVETEHSVSYYDLRGYPLGRVNK